MSFDSILQSIADDCKGVIGIALMENDGIAIAQVQGAAGARGALSVDITSAGIEFGRIIADVAKAADALGGGEASETVVSLARFSLVFHRVDADMVLVLALAPDGNLGKARYLIRRNLVAIRHEL